MITWIWLAGWLLSIYPIAQLIRRDDVLTGDDEPGDRFIVAFFAVIVALVWPLVLIGWLAWRSSSWLWGRILGDREKTHAE